MGESWVASRSGALAHLIATKNCVESVDAIFLSPIRVSSSGDILNQAPAYLLTTQDTKSSPGLQAGSFVARWADRLSLGSPPVHLRQVVQCVDYLS